MSAIFPGLNVLKIVERTDLILAAQGYISITYTVISFHLLMQNKYGNQIVSELLVLHVTYFKQIMTP